MRTPGVSITQPASSGSRSAIADTDVCRPRPIALTTPVSRSASGTSALIRVDLPTPGMPDQHRHLAGQPRAQLGQVAAALGDQHRHVQRVVALEHRVGRLDEVGLGQAEDGLEARAQRGHDRAVDQAEPSARDRRATRRRSAGRRWRRSPARTGRCRRRCGAAPCCARRSARCARARRVASDTSPTTLT